MPDSRKPQKKNKGLGPAGWIILFAALAVFCWSGYQLYGILSGYKAARDEYSSLADAFTKTDGQRTESGQLPESGDGTGFSEAENTESGDGTASLETESTESVRDYAAYKERGAGTPETEREEEEYLIEDAEAPIRVDWNELKAINPDIVGWVYVEGLSNISYPILQGEDNETYLHQTFRKQYLFAGSIFEEADNSPDFADPNTIVYGHNMKDGSMFGSLKKLNQQETYDRDPFFWILTPEGNYRYHIFSVFTASVDSDAFTLYSQNGPEFLHWEELMQRSSDVKNEVPLSKSDKTVILSTCTSEKSARCVVIGKCVSARRPERKQAVGLTVVGTDVTHETLSGKK